MKECYSAQQEINIDKFNLIDILPPHPLAAGLINSLLSSQQAVDLSQLIQIASKEPSITAYLLKESNQDSPGGQPVSTVKDAITKLGLKRSLRAFKEVANTPYTLDKTCTNFVHSKYWYDNLLTAICASYLYQSIEHKQLLPTLNRDIMFTLTLVRHTGLLALVASYPEAMDTVLLTDDIKDLEEAIFDFTHHEVTAILFNNWRLPQDFLVANKHYWGRQLPSDLSIVSQIIHHAEKLVTGKDSNCYSDFFQKFGIPPLNLASIYRNCSTDERWVLQLCQTYSLEQR